MNARKAIFAGSWYPDSAGECEKEINGFLKEIKVKDSLKGKAIGGIVPHAGWYFSGSIACNVINCLKDEKHTDVIIIFGMHLHPDSPCYIMKDGSWETPFGEIPVDNELAGELARKFTFNIETSESFVRDNTIELQLPFIKYFFEDVKIVPMGVPPDKSSLEIGKAAAEIATKMGLCAKVVGSTDLTHYGTNYGFMPEGIGPASLDWVRNENDRRIIDAMLTMDAEAVIMEAMAHQNACCSGAAATAIAAAKQLGARHAESIAYATSYDKSPGDSFVGYTGIVFTD
ncbi:MAG: AmmeMemoRadiSam system protein B [Pseudomonadota bacterium]